MSPTMLMLAALSANQPGVIPPGAAVPAPMPAAVQPPAPIVRVQGTPQTTPPAALPGGLGDGNLTPGTPTTPGANTTPQEASKSGPSPEAKDDEAEEKKEEKWFLMRRLEGSSLGTLMADRRLSVSGWVQQSYTWSTTNITNQPVVWNDRADKYLLNQFWLRLDKAVDTEAKEATFGWRVDNSFGTDYRFSLMRGFLNTQLNNSNPQTSPERQQNLYGDDLIQFYTNVFLPNLFQGTDVRVGRLFTPWGYESLEGPNTPFVSRSYAFNWSPPFTHMGVMISPKFNDQWSGKFMLANGNDVFLNRAEEGRFVGALTWTPRKEDTVTLGWTLGRGVFNQGLPFNPATIGEQTEPAGRNNFNALDLVWAHTLTDKASYAMEAIWGHQSNVPANVSGGIIDTSKAVGQSGVANWLAVAQYFNYAISDKWTSVTRVELFDDARGQRTGFEGVYTAVTTGLAYVPVKDVLIRPSVRYDYNQESRPFEGKHYIWTGVMDLIVRY